MTKKRSKLSIRFTDAEMREINILRGNKTASQYVREMIINGNEKLQQQERDTAADLRQIKRMLSALIGASGVVTKHITEHYPDLLSVIKSCMAENRKS